MTDPPDDDAIAPDEPAPEPASPVARTRPVGRLVRLGCIILGTLGLLSLYVGITTATDPDGAQCNQARALLEDEEEVEDGGDVECDDALARADTLAAESEGSDDEIAEIPTESYFRTVGFIFAGIGALQLVGALLTARTRTKAARLVGLVGAGLGIVLSPLGFLGIPVYGFVVYAIFFSADSRAVFGEPAGPRMFRPRPPA